MDRTRSPRCRYASLPEPERHMAPALPSRPFRWWLGALLRRPRSNLLLIARLETQCRTVHHSTTGWMKRAVHAGSALRSLPVWSQLTRMELTALVGRCGVCENLRDFCSRWTSTEAQPVGRSFGRDSTATATSPCDKDRRHLFYDQPFTRLPLSF